MNGDVGGFIIGAQKAGSTSLDRYLAHHPQVLAARHEVPALEDPHFQRGGVAAAEQWVAEHRTSDHRIAVLRRPNYLCDPVVPSRMAATWPEARLIAVLRDPVDRAVSAYFHYMRYGLISVAEVNEGFRRLMGHRTPTSPRAGEILRFGCYGSGLGSWLHFFPPDRLLVCDSRSLRARPHEVLRQVADHLSIDPEVAPPTIRPGMPGSYGMRHVRARRRVLPLLYSRDDQDRLRARWVLPQLYDRAERMLWKDRAAQPQLEREVRDDLRSYYADDVRLLRSLLPPAQLPSWTASYQ